MTTNLAWPDLTYKHISHLAGAIVPHDRLKREHIEDTLLWLENGVPISRTQEPDVPNRHLVSCFMFFGSIYQKTLPIDRKKHAPLVTKWRAHRGQHAS